VRLAQVEIKNYRSIQHLALDIEGTYTVLLGANNAGKSNILRAIEMALTPSASFLPSDLCTHCPEADAIEVHLRFDSLTKAECVTWKNYLLPDGGVRLVRFGHRQGSEFETSPIRGWTCRPSEPTLRRGFVAGTRRDQIDEAIKRGATFLSALPTTGRISAKQVQECRDAFIAAHRGTLVMVDEVEEGPLFGQRTIPEGVLPELIFVPAGGDLEQESQHRGASIYGRIVERVLRDLGEEAEHQAELRRVLDAITTARNDTTRGTGAALRRLADQIEAQLPEWDVRVAITAETVDVGKTLAPATRLVLDDGHPSDLARKGHGLQRATVFALIRAWADLIRTAGDGESPGPGTILVVEEPELFLHPHAQRAMARKLTDLAADDRHQVVVCSHSTHFLSLADERYRSIRIVARDGAQQTTIRQCRESLEAIAGDQRKQFNLAQWVNQDRAELFFARLVVLVEGPTEAQCLPFLAEKLGIDTEGATVVDCNGKNNLPLYVRMLNGFGLRYVVVHDEDAPIDTDTPKRRKDMRSSFEQNAKIVAAVDGLGDIEVLTVDFERCFEIPTTGDGKPWSALAHLDKADPIALSRHRSRIERIFLAGT